MELIQGSKKIGFLHLDSQKDCFINVSIRKYIYGCFGVRVYLLVLGGARKNNLLKVYTKKRRGKNSDKYGLSHGKPA